MTFTQIWDTVEKQDIGCTPGGGQNNMGVFYDAGLMFSSSASVETPSRQGDDSLSFFPFPKSACLLLDKSKLNYFMAQAYCFLSCCRESKNPLANVEYVLSSFSIF